MLVALARVFIALDSNDVSLSRMTVINSHISLFKYLCVGGAARFRRFIKEEVFVSRSPDYLLSV